jgi:DNA-binding transcriptional ArsR family regulator
MKNLDARFAALSDPTRRAIIARLAKGEATVNQLVARFSLTQPTISSHLKVLEKAGLISRDRVAQTRPCRLNPIGLKSVSDWVSDYEHFWTSAIDRFVSLAESKKHEKGIVHGGKP